MLSPEEATVKEPCWSSTCWECLLYAGPTKEFHYVLVICDNCFPFRTEATQKFRGLLTFYWLPKLGDSLIWTPSPSAVRRLRQYSTGFRWFPALKQSWAGVKWMLGVPGSWGSLYQGFGALHSLNFPFTHHCVIHPHWKNAIQGLGVNKLSIIEIYGPECQKHKLESKRPKQGC